MTILALSELAGIDLTRTGPKAMNLSRLIALKLPVPPGLCVTADAYREHLAGGGLATLTTRTAEQARSADPDRRGELLADLRRAIIDSQLAVEFRAEFERAFRTLGTPFLAVRSSSTSEDLPGHSFAGLYDSFLLKTDIWGCLGAVKKCWASFWTDRAFEYRMQNRIDHLNAAMAVIIQEFIRAESSGVIFTADPVTGSRDQLVIEACFGLGEGLVSGHVTPDRIILDKSRLRVREYTVAEKKTQVVYTDGWGTREWPVEPERAAEPCLDGDAARKLGRYALSIEQSFGAPQDIEWALRGGEFFIVQARPITTLPEPAAARTVWSNVNLAEAMPEPAPPLALALFRAFGLRLMGFIGRFAGFDITGAPLIREFAGREYFNVNLLFGLVKRVPVINRMNPSDLLGGLREDQLPRAGEIPLLRGHWTRALVQFPWLILMVLRSHPADGRRALKRLKRDTDALQRTDFAALTDAELADLPFRVLDVIFDRVFELGGALSGMQYFSLLGNLCRKWFNDAESTIASKLLVGLGDINSAQAGLELWRLADLVRASPELQALVDSDQPWAELRPALEAPATGRAFLEHWDRFMFNDGHHCRGEFNVARPRWRDEPDFLLGTIRGYLHVGPDANPETQLQLRAAEREQLTTECRARLRNPFKRLAFNFLLGRAQLGACVRENLRDDVNRRVGIGRIALLELGRRLTRRGTLAQPDDIFFLDRPELEQVLKGAQAFDIPNTIADRRLEHARNLTLTPPSVIVGDYDPNAVPPEPVDLNAKELTGLAVSPGIATGPARVITGAGGDERVLPGEILVAPFTDPGWTPYFLPAAGIVVDIGGLLSHGSIVAREYGKPAVVNVGPATRIIKTGQMLQVDGN